MFKFPLIVAFLLQAAAFGQDLNYNQLLDNSTKSAGLFVALQPVRNIRLSLSDTTLYKEYLEEVSHYKLDSKVLIELIENSRQVDTTYWSDNELEKSILIKSRDEYVTSKGALSKFKISNKQESKLYRRRINEFNNTPSWDKNIFYFSRPVFDNAKQFAIVQYSNGHSGLSGGGSVTLFHFDRDSWREIGDIEHWQY